VFLFEPLAAARRSVIFGPEDAEPLVGVTQLESAGIVIDRRTGNLTRLRRFP
jgi:predicted aspartyl protease